MTRVTFYSVLAAGCAAASDKLYALLGQSLNNPGPVNFTVNYCNDGLFVVYNGANVKKRAVNVIGMENLILVVSRDAVLIAPKDCAEDVRKAVQEMRQRNATQF